MILFSSLTDLFTPHGGLFFSQSPKTFKDSSVEIKRGHNSFKSNSKAYFNISLLQLGQRERLNGTMNCKRDLSLMGSKISRNLRPENGGLCENSLTFTQV